MAYLHEYQRTSQQIMGRNGRKNCLVRGIIKAVKSSEATKVRNSGLGKVIMERQKMAITTMTKY
jgi:hypothetical protein